MSSQTLCLSVELEIEGAASDRVVGKPTVSTDSGSWGVGGRGQGKDISAALYSSPSFRDAPSMQPAISLQPLTATFAI